MKETERFEDGYRRIAFDLCLLVMRERGRQVDWRRPPSAAIPHFKCCDRFCRSSSVEAPRVFQASSGVMPASPHDRR